MMVRKLLRQQRMVVPVCEMGAPVVTQMLMEVAVVMVAMEAMAVTPMDGEEHEMAAMAAMGLAWIDEDAQASTVTETGDGDGR